MPFAWLSLRPDPLLQRNTLYSKRVQVSLKVQFVANIHVDLALDQQVSWTNLGAGLVVITVTASRITPPPYSPQPFSLVVQGSFTGELESEYNPGWSKATTTSCSLPVAQITTAPPVLSNNRDPVFRFATATDPATAGFHCKLSGTGGSTVPTAAEPLQDWTACSVLPSGGTKTFNFGASLTPVLHTYLFQVRATSASLFWAS